MPSTKTKSDEQKALDIAHIQKAVQIARFKGAPFYMTDDGYWQPLGEDTFRQLAYNALGTLARSRFNEVWDYVQYGVKDLTKYANISAWATSFGTQKR